MHYQVSSTSVHEDESPTDIDNTVEAENSGASQHKRRTAFKSTKAGCLWCIAVVLTLLGAIYFIDTFVGRSGFESTGVTAYTIDEDIDRIIVIPFSHYGKDEAPCLTVNSKWRIWAWKSSHKWTDSYNICCDEATTHKIIALDGTDEVAVKSFSKSDGSYNNFLFNLNQLWLASEFDKTDAPQWQYRIIVSESTSFDALHELLQYQEDWFAYDYFLHNSEASFYLVTPTRLTYAQRQSAEYKYGFSFAMDMPNND